MQFSNLHGTYSVETKDIKVVKYNLDDALNEAVDMQQRGNDVEVWKDGFLKHKLHGIQQYSLF
jgi:hypothetical protein|tara:strand:- start:30 stop:218 length:189 start_codon:yes stop_codon:yes gene_type:complete